MADSMVEIAAGRVRGTERNGIRSFLGMPYAAPPVGERRWAPPAPVEPWSGTRDALAFGPIAPQAEGFAGFVPSGSPQAEDCLTLNVWSPGLDGSRPVMVWIHGGGFRQGASSSALYDGETLARRGDVVVVTINYRLGALGFLAHPDLQREDGLSANWGMLDQVAALEWVRDHAAKFGGDPGNVTIFGESAGAMSVSLLLAAPSARGLFRRAVVESGAPMTPPADRAARVAERLAEAIGVDRVAALRDVPAADIVRAQPAVEGRAGTMVFLPVVDGDFLPEHPMKLVRQGVAAGIPTIVGTNRDEWKLWAPADPHSRDLDEAGLRRRLERRLSDDVDPVIDTYRREREGRGEPVTPNELWFAIESDAFFRVPALRLADALAEHEPATYTYLFTWGSPAMKGWLGACHGLEIAFVFGTQGRSELAAFTGSGPDADHLAELMMDAWLAFARTGDPSTPELGEWPRHDPTTRPTLVLDAKPHLAHAPMEAERRVVDERLAPFSA